MRLGPESRSRKARWWSFTAHVRAPRGGSGAGWVGGCGVAGWGVGDCGRSFAFGSNDFGQLSTAGPAPAAAAPVEINKAVAEAISYHLAPPPPCPVSPHAPADSSSPVARGDGAAGDCEGLWSQPGRAAGDEGTAGRRLKVGADERGWCERAAGGV